MILPDMLKTLTDNARQFQDRLTEWQAAMAKGQEEAMEQARQWQQMQKAWEDQFATMQKQGEEMRAKAMSAAGGTGGSAFADWAETYAAQMVAFTQKMQGESAKAIATATEARGKSGKKA